MTLRGATILIAVLLAFGASAAGRDLEPISRQVFAAFLSAQTKSKGFSLSSRTDCSHPAVNCKILNLPQTMEIWLRPDENGDLASVQINFDAAGAKKETVFTTARDICSAAIAILAINTTDAKALEHAFSRAQAIGHWEGSISGQAISVRIDNTYSFGSCEVTSARKHETGGGLQP